ncbi:MAG: ABC transporter ATP-binding protein [Clostridia bacterium]|nr:ABC transporter ATP-binding protein [Clostridia bacterium]
MIELRGISFAYPGQEKALCDVSVRFPAGKVTTILGPNGSGKSTLMKTACRLLNPSCGQVMLDGRDIAGMKPRELARHMARLGQSNQPPAVTVRDLVSYGRYPHQGCMKALSREDEICIDRALEQVKLEAYQDRTVHALSGGQQQRAYIAMALAQDAKVLFLDEPTSSLDISVRFEIMDLIRQLNSAGKTIVMVLHDLELALQYSDHLILLDQGKVICTGSPQELIACGMLDRVFDIKTRVIEQQGSTIFHFSRTS